MEQVPSPLSPSPTSVSRASKATAVLEGVGTFLMMLVGTAAMVANLGGLLIASAFGLVLVLLVAWLAPRTGAHFNPAVTLALAVGGHFPWRRVPGYLVAQTVGALAAVSLVATARPIASAVAQGTLSPSASFVVEAGITAVLLLVIVQLPGRPRWVAGLSVGGTVFLGAFLAGPFTGAAMNPARALAPAAFSGAWTTLSPTVAGPIVGAVLATVLHRAARRTAPRAVTA